MYYFGTVNEVGYSRIFIKTIQRKQSDTMDDILFMMYSVHRPLFILLLVRNDVPGPIITEVARR